MYHNGVSGFCIPSTFDLCNQVLGGLEMPGSLYGMGIRGGCMDGMEWNGMGWMDGYLHVRRHCNFLIS